MSTILILVGVAVAFALSVRLFLWVVDKLWSIPKRMKEYRADREDRELQKLQDEVR